MDVKKILLVFLLILVHIKYLVLIYNLGNNINMKHFL